MDCPPGQRSGGRREAVAVVERWRFDCSQFQIHDPSRVNKGSENSNFSLGQPVFTTADALSKQNNKTNQTCINSVCAYVFPNISPNCIKASLDFLKYSLGIKWNP